ncbi:hypothetical protein AB1287_10195 [Enterobacter asburiae]|uniref:hypothetical protein n=1 Tax=Scandinavium sp. UTDF21-P1B TaxID=3446379 RepID=UPI00347D435A
MADVFTLAPEGQAWTDDKTAANPAKPEDYDPAWYQGSVSAFPRGVAEGATGLAQSAVGFSKRLISDPALADAVAPTVNIFRVMFPDADKQLNETYDDLSSTLKDARAYVKPDPASQGTAAEVLNGLGQFVPAIGATIAGGPVLGASTAFGSTYEQSYQDFRAKGVDEATARNLAAQQSSFNAAGMALPAALGETLLTRIASGVGINTAFGGLNRFSVGETLEAKGYSDMAKQYRVWDGQAIMIDAVLGGAFGVAHHLSARGDAAGELQAPDAVNPIDAESPIPAPEVQSSPDTTMETSPTTEAVPVTDEPGTPLRPDAQAPVPELAAPPDIPAIKPSDIDAAHTLNEGLYYDIESAPVLHGTNESINSHVAAMDEAARQLSDGQPVNIAMQARGLDGPARPGMLESANEQYHAMEQVFHENGVHYESPREVIRESQAPRSESAFSRVDEDAGQVSIDPDSGQAISSNSYDLMVARDMATANPDLTVTHPDTGQQMKLSDVLADFDEQIQTAKSESKVYSVAAACFLRNP